MICGSMFAFIEITSQFLQFSAAQSCRDETLHYRCATDTYLPFPLQSIAFQALRTIDIVPIVI